MIHHDVVCTFCGCLCDDLDVEVENNRIVGVKKACLVGRNKIMHAQADVPVPSIAGKEVGIVEAVAEAVRILSAARNPLVYGLSSTTTEAQRELVAINELIGGNLDNPASYCHGPGVLARQASGMVSCTLGEVKNRADLVVFWGCNPMESHMRHLSRYSVMAKGLFTPEGRKNRKVVAIDVRPTATTKSADLFLQVTPGQDFEIATVLRALLKGLPLENEAEIGSIAGVPLASWRELVDMMRKCQYGVVFFGLGLTQSRGKDLNIELLLKLVREINQYTRFYAIAMRGHANVNGGNQVMAWQTGFPIAVNANRGYHRFNPGEFSVVDMLARREIDAALVVATDPGAHLPKDAVQALRDIPTITLDPHNNCTTPWAHVVIPVAPAGVGAAGTYYRMDNIPLRVKKIVEFPYPSDEEVLKLIKEKIANVKNN
ncbi:formylmethanofuran dehydrogenase subunit B [Sporomusa sphaeroides]|uniref:formylmethanofuran dehydrogenase subunit B n=1 Tax=Sporomusa sphaeroides TaxID=47679 RepID=UPI0020305BE0|nr:formylmethanofuran dehydrogenase subunit B [Sporomusa sphaeroides]MCM0759195.1 formylmethanofuran dehydrogenase subunit B [Sporomusa sphaeroides DSM 2875]HML35277.1 formylmethanofuran dehydrogenase subunit B [Sporomusa sphaeroides]